MKKIIVFLAILVLFFIDIAKTDEPILIYGCYSVNGTPSVPDSCRIFITDSLLLDLNCLINWNTVCFESLFHLNAVGYVIVEYHVFDGNDSVYYSEKVDINPITPITFDSILNAVEDNNLGMKVFNRPFNSSFANGSIGDSLNNPLYVQGAASGLTAYSIWSWYFSNLKDSSFFDSTIAGIYWAAAYLNKYGIRDLSILIRDSVNDANVSNCAITVIDTAQTNTIGYGWTDANGWKRFTTPASYVKIRPYQYRFSFPATTYTINLTTMDITDTIYCSPLTDPEPVTTEVYGYIYRPDNVIKSGITVRASINQQKVKLTRNSIPISPIWVSDTTDINGYWSMVLYVSDSLTPAVPWRIEALDSLGKPFNWTSVYVQPTIRQKVLW